MEGGGRSKERESVLGGGGDEDPSVRAILKHFLQVIVVFHLLILIISPVVVI